MQQNFISQQTKKVFFIVYMQQGLCFKVLTRTFFPGGQTFLTLALAFQGHSVEGMAGCLFQNLMHFHFQSLPLLHWFFLLQIRSALE